MSKQMLRDALRGQLIEPDGTDYDAARTIWNGMVDRRPALIARCRNAADVAACISYARNTHLPLAVRSGGHNVAGYAMCDGGLVIDLSLMNAVRVSPGLDRVFIEGGATWADVDAATTPFGRATPGGLVSATGVGGLTLSGGIGWLRGTHGLCVDNLLAAELVTADSRLIRADAHVNPELLWALKGDGGNFGVVVLFEFRLHPIAPELMFCAPAYAEEEANDILPKWRDFFASAPDEVSGLAEFSTIPQHPDFPEHAWGRRVVTLATGYDGDPETGERITRPLRELAAPLIDFSERRPYRTLQSLYDGLFPKGRDRAYWNSTYLRGLDNEVIREITASLAERPSEMTFASIWSFSGAVQRVASGATAFGDRLMPFMLSLDAIWSSPTDDEANIGWVRRVWDVMQRHSTGRLYLNFPGHGEDIDLTLRALGPENYARLQQVKRNFDPDNLFRNNQNVSPVAST